jgi:exodeoxyribonuclease-1
MSFYFYDLETSGFSPKRDRIMQFAGQRTDENLNEIGKPDNFYIKITPDILPDPGAVLVHGTTPQKTLAEGISEAEFLKYFSKKIMTADTIFLGYNSIRFDDDFMRFLMWRNFYDSYEWHWKDGCSRWDLLDLVRMTRALRPDGIKWPVDSEGQPSNRLELLSKVNKLDHAKSHDALGDVKALVGLSRLIKSKQPRLFEYLLNIRDKKKVRALVETGEPFIYTSGSYPKEYAKTTAAVIVATHPNENAALVYDLRENPAKYLKMSQADLAKLWLERGKDKPYFPVKILKYNKCPAIAPMSVLDRKSSERLNLEPTKIEKNLAKLHCSTDFSQKLIKILEIKEKKFQASLIADEWTVDEQLYDGFLPDSDKLKTQSVRSFEEGDLKVFNSDFSDKRLAFLLILYKARNYPGVLNPDEKKLWDEYLTKKLFEGEDGSRLEQYLGKIKDLRIARTTGPEKLYLLDELELYAQSILPAEGL